MNEKSLSHPLSDHTKPTPCPDPLCLLDLQEPVPCPQCPQNGHKPGWGGRRPGAGAPQHNLNRLTHGQDSKLIRTAVEKLAADPELRAFLLLIARAAVEGEIPQTTKQLIMQTLGKTTAGAQVAARQLRRLRDES